VDDIELFAKLLRIAPPWRVTRVSVDVAAARVEVGVEEIPDAQFPCAVGRAPPGCAGSGGPVGPRRGASGSGRWPAGGRGNPAGCRPASAYPSAS